MTIAVEEIIKKRFLFTALQLFLVAAAGFDASVSPSAAYQGWKIEVRCAEFWLVTYPGTSVTFNIQIRNTSPAYDNYTLQVDDPPLPDNWTGDFYSKNRKVKGIEIGSLQSVNLVLEVKVPEDAAPKDYEFRMCANGTNSVGTLVLMVTVENPLSIQHKIGLVCTPGWQITTPGKSITLNIELKNDGPDYDSYFLYIDNPPLPENWTASFYVDGRNVKEVKVNPRGIVNLVLQLSVPDAAAPSDYRFRVHVDGSYASATQAMAVTVKATPREVDLVCPFETGSTLTGQRLSYLIKVANEGEQTERILLRENRTADMMTWDISFSKTELMLPPKSSEWVTLNVKSPGIVEARRYFINVTASTEDGNLRKTIPIVAEILSDYLLEIVGIQPLNPQVAGGEKINILVTVRNMGQSPLTKIRLDVNSTAISNIFTMPVDVLALEPMSSVSYYISIAPETYLTPGNYLIEVQAESVETQSSVRALVVSVVSPIPWFWISIALTVIATSLAVIAIERVVSKYGIKIRVRRTPK